MKRSLVAILVILNSGLLHAAELADQDKQKHVAASAGIALASYSTLRSMKMKKLPAFVTSMALTLTIGHLKERNDPVYDSEDMQANLAGAGVGLSIPLTIDF